MIILRGNDKLNKEQLATLIDKIKVLVYARVSSDGQVDNYSIESQIEICVKDAEAKYKCSENEIIVCVEEGESGDNPNRPMVNYLLFLLNKGVGNKVVILHPSRLSRYLHLQQNVTHKIWEMGCDLHFVEFDLDKDNAESMFMYNIQGSVSQYNKAKILADTKRGRRTKLESGKIPGINRIYGYTFDKEQDILVENPTEKQAYLFMVSMVVDQDKSCSEVARTIAKEYSAPSGAKWYQATISRMLRNPAYKGLYFYGKTEIKQVSGKKIIIKKPENEWYSIPIPTYIEDERFNKLQIKLDALAKKSKAGRPSDNLLKGIGRCGKCESAVSAGGSSKSKNTNHKYYVCTNKSKKSFEAGSGKHNATCKSRGWRTDYVDDLVWKYVCDIITNPEQLIEKMQQQNEADQDAEKIRMKIKKVTKDIADKKMIVDRYIDSHAEGFIKTKQELAQKISKHQDVIDELEKELKILENHVALTGIEKDKVQIVSEMLSKFKKIVARDVIDLKDKQMLIKILVKKVIFKDDELEVVLTFGGTDPLPPLKRGKEQTEAHINLNAGQSDGLNIYVSESITLTKQKTQTQLNSVWIKYEDRLDELIHLYHHELLTFEEMGKRTSIEWWNIKRLFKFHNVERIKVAERNRLRLDKQGG